MCGQFAGIVRDCVAEQPIKKNKQEREQHRQAKARMTKVNEFSPAEHGS
jgi:hypothetical protein